MIGEAITAGSKPSFLASSGSVEPTILARQTVTAIVAQTTKATRYVTLSLFNSNISTTMIFAKQAIARHTPQRTDTRISFQTTRPRSRNSISFRLMPRMMDTQACEPELPPVSISMGMNAVRHGRAASEFSNLVMTMPVSVAETISSSSHGIRFFQISTGVERIYGCSDGSIAAIFSMSSVASSSMTSMASSKVTMPTSRFSVSTTGRARKLYLLNIWATCSLSSSVPTVMTCSCMMDSMVASSSSHRSRSLTLVRPISLWPRVT